MFFSFISGLPNITDYGKKLYEKEREMQKILSVLICGLI
jgi:hypothetical protein